MELITSKHSEINIAGFIPEESITLPECLYILDAIQMRLICILDKRYLIHMHQANPSDLLISIFKI